MRMASPQSLSELVQIWSSKAIPLVAQVYRLFRTLYTSYMTQQLKIAQQNCETNCKENCLSKSKRPLEFCVYLLCQSSWLINEYCSHFSAFLLANPGLGHLSYGLILLLFYHAKARSKKYQRRIGNERHKLTRTATQSLRADFNRPFPSSLVPLFQNESKCEAILMKMALISMKMKLHAELIFTRMVSHLDLFWNRRTRELGNGLLGVAEQFSISQCRKQSSNYFSFGFITVWVWLSSLTGKYYACLVLVLRHSNENRFQAKTKVIKGYRQKTVRQSKLTVRTFKARENVCERVAIGFVMTSSYFS